MMITSLLPPLFHWAAASVPLGGTWPHDEESTSRARWRLAGVEAEHPQAARHPLAAPG